LTLNASAEQKRRQLVVPVPRYVHVEEPQAKPQIRERSESISTARDECTPANTNMTNNWSPQKSVESSEASTRHAKKERVSKEKLKLIKMDLAFDNESGELATRCDVVYKTILRDFRRFFLDSFKQRKHQSEQKLDLSDSLLQFTLRLFPNKSVKECKVISIDLGCLLFPKEMTKDSKVIREIERTNHFGLDADDATTEIMRIHGFLYKFSIDKIEECFQNPSLCLLFQLYVDQTRSDRISSNPTMSKNASIYLKARRILEEKASKPLSL
jgi:hypothetical protein